VLLSGLLWHGTPPALDRACSWRPHYLVISAHLIAELARAIARPKFHAVLARSGTDPRQRLGELRRLADIFDPPPLQAPLSRDPDDDAVLALAVAAPAEMIVSGDGDLRVLGAFGGIRIVTPAEALGLLQA
jgi:putative PIN family toxin of toxin-antitoxin system